MIAAMGGTDEFRRSAERRRLYVLPPPTPRTGGGIGGTTS